MIGTQEEEFDLASFPPHSPALVQQHLEHRLCDEFEGRAEAIDLLVVSVCPCLL